MCQCDERTTKLEPDEQIQKLEVYVKEEKWKNANDRISWEIPKA